MYVQATNSYRVEKERLPSKRKTIWRGQTAPALLITAELRPTADLRSSKAMSHRTWQGSKTSARHQSELNTVALGKAPDDFL